MSRAPRVCLVQVGGSDQLSTRTPTSSCQDFVTWQYGEFEPFFLVPEIRIERLSYQSESAFSKVQERGSRLLQPFSAPS